MTRHYFWFTERNTQIDIGPADLSYLESWVDFPLINNKCCSVYIEESIGDRIYCKWDRISELTEDVFKLKYNLWSYRYGGTNYKFVEFHEHILYKNRTYVGFLLALK